MAKKLASESKGAPAPTWEAAQEIVKQLEIDEEWTADLRECTTNWIHAIIAAHCQAPAPADRYIQLAEMLREMATEKPDMKLWVAASVLLGSLRKPTESDIRQGQEIAEKLAVAATPQGTPPTPELEPGEFFITRGDGVQERCRYVGQSIEVPANTEALPDKCPTCGSGKFWIALPRCHGEKRNPWHSSAATQKEK